MILHLFLPFLGTTFSSETTLDLTEHLVKMLLASKCLISLFKKSFWLLFKFESC